MGELRERANLPIPSWLEQRDLNELRARAAPSCRPTETATDDGELEFWNEPPRYSVTSLQSLLPAALAPSPPRWRTWCARFPFGAIVGSVALLLGLEARSLLRASAARSSASAQESTVAHR